MRNDSSKLIPALAKAFARPSRGATAAVGSEDWLAQIGYEAAAPALHTGLLPRGIRWEETLEEIDGCRDE